MRTLRLERVSFCEGLNAKTQQIIATLLEGFAPTSFAKSDIFNSDQSAVISTTHRLLAHYLRILMNSN
jgi:S-adenosylhomocysteine hydrolase